MTSLAPGRVAPTRRARTRTPLHAGLARALALLLAFLPGCGSTPLPPLMPDPPAATELRAVGGDAPSGAALLVDRRFGRTGLSCESCHTLGPGEALRPAPPLGGAAERADLWSGHAPDVQSAIGLCAERYLAIAPPNGEILGHLVAAVRALPASPPASAALARPETPTTAGDGDRASGRAIYERACAHCHQDGPGPPLFDHAWPPDALVAAVRGLDRPRHPGSLMPPFPPEALDEPALRDLAAFFASGGDSRLP